jgi:hypothetical protein
MAANKEQATEVEHASDVERTGHASGGLHTTLRTVDLGLDAGQVITSFDPKEEARILRKIDWHLVPLLSFLYL